jgi:hypothetical protein
MLECRKTAMLAAICFAVCAPTAPSHAGGDPPRLRAKLDADYTATLLGIPVGRISWTIEVRDDRFSASADGKTVGLLRVFDSGHGAAESRGIVSARRAMASNFTVRYATGHSSGTVKILFKDDKAKEYLSDPPRPDPQQIPLTDAYRIGVVDPMTALLIRVPGEGNPVTPAACVKKIAVFDGHMRYDLRLDFKRIAEVKADDGYQGPAVVCTVHFTPLAGYNPHRYAIRYLRAERDLEMWLAPLAGTRLMVPFRVSVPTPIGLGVLQATRFLWTRENSHARPLAVRRLGRAPAAAAR